MPPHTPSLLGFGSALVDVLADVDEGFLRSVPGDKGGTQLVSPDDMDALLRRLPNPPVTLPGGAARNTLAAFARLGGRAAMLAVTGDDPRGHLYRQSLRDDGVSDAHCRLAAPGHPTGTVLSLITPDAERTMRTNLGANLDVDTDTFRPADFQGFSHFLLEGYAFRQQGIAADLARKAHDAGLTVCLDCNAPEVVTAYHDELREVLTHHVSLVFANELEATAFAGSDRPTDALRAFLECCDLAAVKLGRHGCLLQRRGDATHLHIPAFAVETPRDTTGAGDFWAAGFLASLLAGHSLAEAGRFGARVAAEVVQVVGTALPAPVWQRLRDELNPTPTHQP